VDVAAVSVGACDRKTDRQTGARVSVVGIATVTSLDGSGSSSPGKGKRLSLLHTLSDWSWGSRSPFRVFMTSWTDVTFTTHFIENIIQL
jgi:hypothetical protein